MPWLYLLSTGLTLMFTIIFCSLLFHYDKSEILTYIYCFLALVLVFALTALYFGRKAFKHDSEEFWFVNVIFFVPVFMILSLGEIWARFQMPPWPAIALHGVDPSVGKTEWGRIQSLYPDAVGNNSWGQRDRERYVDSFPGKTRTAFVGDSFLEESSLVPVSLRVENELAESFEVINLGVSTNDTVDYYWSVKNIVMKIKADHVVVFFYMGNDILLEKPSLRSIIRSGILSPPPRDSILGMLLPGFNYFLTKGIKRPISWIYSNRHGAEQSRLAKFKEIGIEGFPYALLSYCESQESCLQKLKKKNLRIFYKKLINPDLGLFRSFAIQKAVCEFCNPHSIKPEKLNSHQIEMLNYTVNILKIIKKITTEAGIDFTVVIVPQGFEVDDRMWEQWKILNDFRITLHYIILQAEYIKNALDENNIDYLDLYPILEHTHGTYLNFDGHWSESGNQLAADALVEYLRNSYSVH